MATLQQIMLLCRPGFEGECAAELMQHATDAGLSVYIKAGTNNGYAHLASAQHSDISSLLDCIDFRQLVFARQWFACTDTRVPLPVKNRTAPLVAAAQHIRSECVNDYGALELGYADTNEGKALNRFCKAFRPHMLDALKQRKLLSPRSRWRLHVFFVDSTNAWVGVSPTDNSAHRPMGITRLRMPASAPSRSTLKLEEAILWFLGGDQGHRWFKPGMRAVDLGAAPGGWTWQLVRRGLLVTAVDNGPMDPVLMDSGMVEHARADAFTFVPPARVDWLVCDMAERPLHVARLVARWFTQNHCSAAIFNLKLPMKKRYQTVMACRQLLHESLDRKAMQHQLLIKQLYHDREEVTACLLTENDALQR